MSPLGIMKLAVAVFLMQFCRQSVQYTRCDETEWRFGKEGRYTCHCQDIKACDFHKDGNCTFGRCLVGYQGPNCQKEGNKGCSTGWFGPECTKKCQCHNYAKCHQTTGRCDNGCLSGRHGDDCQQLNYDNIALGKTAHLTSIDSYGTRFYINGDCRYRSFTTPARLAVDGIYDPSLHHQSCADTDYKASKSYWTVDLAKNYSISQIRVFNRDKSRKRMKGVIVYVGSERFRGEHICHTIGNEYNNAVIDIICKSPITGDTVTIYKPNYDYFTLCEVEVLQCKEDYFGIACKEICHCLDNSKCNRSTGKCSTGCAPGYKNVDCQTECTDGYFGINCKKICHCSNNSICDRTTGNCSTGCAPGYKNDDCQTECTDGYFGIHCKQICHCLNNTMCDKFAGNCSTGCAPGYTEYDCQTVCPYGTFGLNCSGNCNCNNNSFCDIVNGICGDKRTENQALLLVVGAPIMIFVIFLVVIIVGAIFWYRKTAEQKLDNQNEGLGLEDIPVDKVKDQEHNHELIDDSEDIYANVLPTVQLSKANIVSYVRERKQMEETPFNQEFSHLPKGLLYPCHVANAKTNKSKNRYKTVVPYDHSRVTLVPDEISSSEYINATFISDGKFIATQGPTKTALVDFWRMIWQQKCNTIIMLTDFMENEKVKCTKYWSDGDSPEIFGTIHVKRIKKHRYGFYIHRVFEISKPQTDDLEKWTIDHYFFCQWPDHGVPEYPEYLLDFRNKIKSSPFARHPVVVHCSAGIGRTGTYICLDIMLEQMTRNQPLDVLQCVRELREERTMMVQKREQLEFIFDVLAENALTEDTVFCVESFPGEYNRITARENVEISILEKQFQDLLMPLTTATRRTNITKEYTDDEGNILTLKEGTVFINGHTRENQFILTSTPTMKDVVELLELVFHSRCQHIVMFGESIQEAVVYLPTEVQKVISCGPFNIELIQQNENDTCTHRTLKISYLKRGNVKELIVNHSQFKIWFDKGFPLPGEMLHLIKLVNNHHHQSVETMTKILVHCKDGTSKSGMFCALYILTSMLETEKSISIVRLLRQIKKREPLVVTDLDSYHYCWLVGKSFQEEHSIYSN